MLDITGINVWQHNVMCMKRVWATSRNTTCRGGSPNYAAIILFDLGLKTFLADHEGNAYNYPQHFNAAMNEVSRLNRALSRKVEGSNGWTKAKGKPAKAHLKIAINGAIFFGSWQMN